jgi:hypothetical protein
MGKYWEFFDPPSGTQANSTAYTANSRGAERTKIRHNWELNRHNWELNQLKQPIRNWLRRSSPTGKLFPIRGKRPTVGRNCHPAGRPAAGPLLRRAPDRSPVSKEDRLRRTSQKPSSFPGQWEYAGKNRFEARLNAKNLYLYQKLAKKFP